MGHSYTDESYITNLPSSYRNADEVDNDNSYAIVYLIFSKVLDEVYATRNGRQSF